MTLAPQSRLTYERPDLWVRALILATELTGLEYAPKLPLADGTIYACGYGGYYQETPAEEIKRRERAIEHAKEQRQKYEHPTMQREWDIEIARQKDHIERLKRENPTGFDVACRVFVPEGAMEWLLHEVGHWVVATPEERVLPNYGYGAVKQKGWGAAREWQAWGFEEIILAPFGPARLLAAPEHQGGTVYSKIGPMPDLATAHTERQMRKLNIDRDRWRQIYGEWVQWGTA